MPANCEPNGSPLRQSLLLLLSSDSPHSRLSLSFSALFSVLSLSLFNKSKRFFSELHCLLHLPNPHLLFYLIIPAHSTSHHHTPQCITLLTSPAAPPVIFSTSYITSRLHNPPYNVIFSKILFPGGKRSPVLHHELVWYFQPCRTGLFCYIYVLLYRLSSFKHVPVSSLGHWSGSQ